ncbi:hypothetical protein [Phaeobacter sp. HF9A]|nr:hypothetical protein [Phaeobacter sp. HF9A]NIZ12905.1 hypothetical protein [Phaeobacter sp. HF9A]
MTKPKAPKPKLPVAGGSFTVTDKGELKQVAGTQPKPPRQAAAQAAPKEA